MKNTVLMTALSILLISVGCSQEKENSGSQADNDAELLADNSTSTNLLNIDTMNASNSNVTDAQVAEGKTINLTNEMFLKKVMDYETNTEEWVFRGDKPCLIDFYASWCGPCKIAAPILEELAAEYAGKIDVYKVNTQVEQQLSAVFGIRSIPTFLYCPKEGRPVMAAGIGGSPGETKQFFKDQIDTLLLGEKGQE